MKSLEEIADILRAATIEDRLASLNVATEILAIKDRWISGSYARVSPSGRTTNPTSKHAKCFCLEGALQRADNIHYKFGGLAASQLSREYNPLSDWLILNGYDRYGHVHWNDDVLKPDPKGFNKLHETLQLYRRDLEAGLVK